MQQAYKLLSDVDLKILMHSSYGKGFMKQCKVSPDAYIQMALQLAYYRVSEIADRTESVHYPMSVNSHQYCPLGFWEVQFNV